MTPPRLPKLLLTFLLPERYRDQQIGDLDEGFRSRATPSGVARARAWYWRQVLKSVGPAISLRIRHARLPKPSESNAMDTLFQDLRFAVRAMIKRPSFAVVATATLALAIGVNTAIFSLVSVIVFADLPMQDKATVSVIRSTNPQQDIDRAGVSYADFLDIRDQVESLESVSALTGAQWVMSTDDGEPLRVTGNRITVNTLDTWRLSTVAGRGFLPGEDLLDAEPVAIMAHNVWVSRFGSDPGVVGSTFRLDGVEHTVVGIMTPKMEFADLGDAEFWVPTRLDRESEPRDQRVFYVSGRLRPGATHAQVQQQIAVVSSRLADEYPTSHGGWVLSAQPVQDSLVDDQADTILLLLSMTVAFVLLIACANVANMLLARATSRGRELAVRAALGARRVRLVRQLLTEAFLIALTASALGLALAKGLLEALVLISAGSEPVFLMAELDLRVLLFTLGVALATPLAFGLLPALSASSGDATAALKEGSARSGGRRGARTRGLLVGAQMSLAVMLMVVAGLMVRSVIKLQTRTLGFDPDGLLTAEIDLPDNKYTDDESIREFYRAMQDEVTGLPGVAGAELASARPAIGLGDRSILELEGRPASDGAARPVGFVMTVTPGYMDLLGIPLMKGRAFGAQDDEESFRVALVSREAAERFWPDNDAVGARFRIVREGAEEWIQVVGVVADLRSAREAEKGDPQIYVPFAQNPESAMIVLARTAGDPALLGPGLRQAVWSVDPEQPVDEMRTMDEAIYERQSGNYALIMLFSTFAVFALVMAAVGIYGVMSYSVSQRSAEISIRRALGAESDDVSRMILGQGAKILVLGIAAGMVGAFLLSRMVAGIVFGISATDPVTFIGVPAILGLVALVANYVPARRATKIDPMTALRME